MNSCLSSVITLRLSSLDRRSRQRGGCWRWQPGGYNAKIFEDLHPIASRVTIARLMSSTSSKAVMALDLS
jgi:hypothetical protein